MENRVVITGMGVLGPNFNNCHEFWKILKHGTNCISKLKESSLGTHKIQIGGKVNLKEESLSELNRRLLLKCDLFSIYSLLAVKEALKDARLGVSSGIQNERFGIYIGNNGGGWSAAEKGLLDLHSEGVSGIDPFLASNWFPAAVQGHVSISNRFFGYSKTVVADMASSNISIGNAYNLIKRGKADFMVAGGAENTFSDWGLSFYNSSGLLSLSCDTAKGYVPFDNQKSGLVLAEGAAFVVLESLESAMHRNVPIYAEIAGFGLTNDGFNYSKGNPDGKEYARSIRLSLRDLDEIPDYISLNGSAIDNEDKSELNGLALAFKDKNKTLTCSCPKTLYGHSFGAAGAMDVISTCLMLKNDLIIQMRSSGNIDCDENLDFVTQNNRAKIINKALVINKGIGGINSSLQIKKIDF